MTVNGFLATDMLADEHEHAAAVEEIARDVNDDEEEKEYDNNHNKDHR